MSKNGKNKKKAEEAERIKDFKSMVLLPGTIVKVSVSHIRPNPDQPRKFFREEDLVVLAGSFENGDVDCPIHITIRDTFALIIDGERRYRAALTAGLSEISCQIFNKLDDKEVFGRSARANLGRKDMSPVEVARTIKKLMGDNGWSQAEAAKRASLHPTQVSQLLKYLNLYHPIQEMLIRGEISNGVALIVACYPQENQSGILERLLAERRKLGGKIDQNTALRLAKMTAEQQGYTPCKQKKGGEKKILCHTDAVVKNVLAKITSLEKALDEMVSAQEVSGEEFFKHLKVVNILEVERRLKEIKMRLKHSLSVVSEFA